MAGATVQNVQAATYPEQARRMQADDDAVTAGFNKTGVLSGLAASAGGGMNVAITAGQVIVGGNTVVAIAAQNVAVTSDPVNSRYVWIVSDVNGALSAQNGSWDSTRSVPVKPALPANSVAIAEVFLPAGASTVAAAMLTDKRVILNSPQQVESLTRLLIVGHSLAAEGGASRLDAGSMHKFANLFPARFRNIAQGSAVAVLPGVWATSQSGIGGIRAGWGHVFSNEANRERSGGINTTLTNTIGPNYASGTSTLVGASAGGAIYQPVMVGRGATAEMTYLGVTDATHVYFLTTLVNQHVAGEPVVSVPDAYLAPRQTIVMEYNWNDLGWMGMTTWSASFIHCYRAIIARLRCCAQFEADSVLVRGSTSPGGAWTQTATAAGYASGNKYMSHGNAGATITIDVPVNFPAGANVVLFFLTAANGDGASWNIAIDGDTTHSVNYDTRNINGFYYNAGAGTRAANGEWMASCYVVRGLAAGAHTIVLSQNAQQGAAYFQGFGITAPDPPPFLIERPDRRLLYSLYSSPLYTPTDADKTTMDTAISNLVAEFTSPTSTVFGGTATPDVAMFAVEKDSVIAKNPKYFWYDGAHYNDQGHAELSTLLAQVVNNVQVPLRNMILPTVNDQRNFYPVYAFGDTAWTPPYQARFTDADWQNISGGLALGYYKDIPSGVVEIQGEIACSNPQKALNSVIFTLPVAHRPANQKQFVVPASGGPTIVLVEPNDDVKCAGGINAPASGANGWLVLTGVRFPAEQ